MEQRPPLWMRAALPWAVYVALLLLLAIVDRATTTRGVGAYDVVDYAINGVGLLGLPLASFVAVFLRRGGRSPGGAYSLLMGFLGPLIATTCVSGISPNVDGALWMIFSPVLGILFVSLALGIRAVVRRKERA